MFRKLLFMVMILCLAASEALAAYQVYQIQPEAMKLIEQGDSFDVRITEKKLIEGYFEDRPDDVLMLTVTNFGSETISAVNVTFVVYEQQNDCNTMEFNTDKSEYAIHVLYQEERQLNTASLSDLTLRSGDTAVVAVRCNWNGFDGVRAMVSSCTTADGRVFNNPDFSAWESYAYGIQSNVTELD